jgi:hypothetical protein
MNIFKCFSKPKKNKLMGEGMPSPPRPFDQDGLPHTTGKALTSPANGLD